jgi:hypothetical protein
MKDMHMMDVFAHTARLLILSLDMNRFRTRLPNAWRMASLIIPSSETLAWSLNRLCPFRGGPFRYLDQVGVSNYVDTMNGFADKYGPQFEPCQLLKDYAASGKKFILLRSLVYGP